MKCYDAAVIGGGVLGCFTARNLCRWKLSVVLAEQAQDVCTGITRANSAIIYAGYDNKVGSRKANMTVAGNAGCARLCQELEVPFQRPGSLMVSTGPRGDSVLRKKLEQGTANGVSGLQILSGEAAREREPMLSEGIRSALYAPSTGTVNPWQLGIAAFENALHNGCEARMNTPIRGIRRHNGGYVLETDTQPIFCKEVLNCAGLQADRVQELVFPPSIRIFCNAADFLVLDRNAPSPRHILFQEREAHGRGIAAIPTTEGNLLLEGALRPLDPAPWATTREGLLALKEAAGALLPELALDQVIRSFAAVRPNPHRVVLQNGQWVPDGSSIGSFAIENPGPGFYSLIGIKTPGLTCAQELGMYLAGRAAQYLNARENPGFDPHRKAITQRDADILCQCEGITQAQVRQAIARGATTVDAVKRRVGTGMGRCQGSRCSRRIRQLLEEAGYGQG